MTANGVAAAGGGTSDLESRRPELRPAGLTVPLAVLGVGLLLWGLAGGTVLADVVTATLDLVFLAYFVRHTAFAFSRLGQAGKEGRPPPSGDAGLPSVTVISACKNEESVIERLTSALLTLDYPGRPAAGHRGG